MANYLFRIVEPLWKLIVYIFTLIGKVYDGFLKLLWKIPFVKTYVPKIRRSIDIFLFRIPNKYKDAVTGLLFVAPWIVGFIIFTGYPIIYSFILSLNKVDFPPDRGITLTWVGFANYATAFSIDRTMLELLISFLQESVVTILVINVFALLFAILLTGNIKGRGFFRTIFFLPVIVVSGPVIGELLRNDAITVGDIGNLRVLYIIYNIFGEEVYDFLVNTFSNLIYMFWFSGVQLLIYLAVLQKRDAGIYEAAEIDGASPWESFWKITLPMMKPVIFINTVYTIILLATFDNNPVTNLIKNTMFGSSANALNAGYGFATALAWIYFVAIVMMIIIAFLLLMTSRSHKVQISLYSNEYEHSRLRYQTGQKWYNTNPTVAKWKTKLFGLKFTDGWVSKAFSYMLLGSVSFAFLYPFLYMLLTSVQSVEDVLSPTVGLIPTSLYFGNYLNAFKVMNFWESLKTSVIYAGIPSVAQVLSAAIIGYGLSRFNFPLKKIIIALIIVAFVVPPSILMIPTYLLYKDWGILGDIRAFLYPALLGQGFKSTIFILLFYNAFNNVPKVIDEAARVDGSSAIGIFFRIALPLSVPMIIVGFLFTFVWYWNETYLTNLYMSGITTMPMALTGFAATFREMLEQGQLPATDMRNILNESIYLAGTLVSLLPLLVLYFVMQNWFVESSDKAGITGE